MESRENDPPHALLSRYEKRIIEACYFGELYVLYGGLHYQQKPTRAQITNSLYKAMGGDRQVWFAPGSLVTLPVASFVCLYVQTQASQIHSIQPLNSH